MYCSEQMCNMNQYMSLFLPKLQRNASRVASLIVITNYLLTKCSLLDFGKPGVGFGQFVQRSSYGDSEAVGPAAGQRALTVEPVTSPVGAPRLQHRFIALTRQCLWNEPTNWPRSCCPASLGYLVFIAQFSNLLVTSESCLTSFR